MRSTYFCEETPERRSYPEHDEDYRRERAEWQDYLDREELYRRTGDEG